VQPHVAQTAVNSSIENLNVLKNKYLRSCGWRSIAPASEEIADMEEEIISITNKDSDKEEPMELPDNKSINEFPDVSKNNKFLTEEIKRTPEQTVNTVSRSVVK
jgi:hypothetical protein